MAKSSSLVSHIEAFVDSSCSSAHQPRNHSKFNLAPLICLIHCQTASVSAITSLVKSKVLTLEALVKEMELYLTNRTILFGQEIGKPYMGLVGCLALLTRKSSVHMVTESDARVLLQTLLSTVHVQTLAVKDRKLCYEILLCLFDCFPEAAKTQIYSEDFPIFFVQINSDDISLGFASPGNDIDDPKNIGYAYHQTCMPSVYRTSDIRFPWESYKRKLDTDL